MRRFILSATQALLPILIFGQEPVQLESSPNFRTYNGLKNKEGKSFRDNLLFRSGSITRLPEADRQRLKGLNLSMIIDFRSDYEVQREPDDTSGLHVRTLRIPMGNVNQQTSLTMFQTLKQPGTTESTVDSLMMGFYMGFAATVGGYRPFFEAVLKGDNRILFHCSAGKDRTGIASALLLHALDFEKPVIMEDFLLSNAAVGKTDMNKLAMYGIPEAFGRVLMGVKPSYLETAWSRMEQAYGSIDSLLAKEFGIGPQEKRRLKEIYLQ
jgi:protein-tyrosine phosphatase